MSSPSDADIKELIESAKGMISSNYALLERLDSILKRFEFLQDPRYKSFDHNRS